MCMRVRVCVRAGVFIFVLGSKLSVRILIQLLQPTSSFALHLNSLAKHTRLLESAHEAIRITSKWSLIIAMDKKKWSKLSHSMNISHKCHAKSIN